MSTPPPPYTARKSCRLHQTLQARRISRRTSAVPPEVPLPPRLSLQAVPPRCPLHHPLFSTPDHTFMPRTPMPIVAIGSAPIRHHVFAPPVANCLLLCLPLDGCRSTLGGSPISVLEAARGGIGGVGTRRMGFFLAPGVWAWQRPTSGRGNGGYQRTFLSKLSL